MSNTIEIKIDGILGGIAPTEYLSGDSQYGASLGIDPELPISDTKVKASGIIRPSAFEKFSGSNVNFYPIAIITTPKNSLVYVVLSNGRLISYTSSLAGETLIGSVAGGLAEGAWYDNDYIYISTPTNVSRYGPLSGTPALTDSVWTSSTLGTQTALTNNTYPSLLGVGSYPQHWGFRHKDNKTYVLDFKDNQGMLHYIKTTYAGVNDGSTYNALDLSFGYYPTCGCSYGNDIVITGIQTLSSTVNQGDSSIFFWDTVDTSFYREVVIPGLAMSCFVNSGTLYVWSGSISGKGGYTLYVYMGENTFKPIQSIPEGFPPPPGAIDATGGRIVWGSFQTEPVSACEVLSYGSKDGVTPAAKHSIARSTVTHTSTDGMITALKYALQGTYAKPTLLIGASNNPASQYHIDKPSTTYQTVVFRTKMINVGQKFQINNVKFPLGVAVGANMTITPKIYADDESKIKTLKILNISNFRNKRKYKDNNTKVNGENNFFLELTFSGTALVPVLLPIIFNVDLLNE